MSERRNRGGAVAYEAALFQPIPAPSVDELEFDDLYELEDHVVDTEDGWRLALSRYRPRSQPFPQPLYGVPLLLVHGYTQSRRAWDTGEFIKNMLYFGADVFVVELRGHGKSSVAMQRRHARRDARPLPNDLDYGWDLDSYLLYDLPATVTEVKRLNGRNQIFYCGHSLGGILGYAYATLFDDLMGLATIGSPTDFSRMPFWLRAIGWGPPLAFTAVDLVLSGLNVARVAARVLHRATSGERSEKPFEPLRFRRLPWKFAFQWLEQRLKGTPDPPLPGAMKLAAPLLYQPRNVALSALRPLLREGANDEPRATAEQFARWLRRGELVSYRIRHNVAAAFPRIRVPVAIFFGDEDPMASVRTTRNVYRSVSSEYLLWRPVRGSSHLDLTMGYDIRQICYDVKNLMTYALDHVRSRPSLPRRRRVAAARRSA
jgi:pimeloyl-ACP methyl ester carboxylesterase